MSLRWRLTLTYAAIFGVTLILFSLLIYYIFAAHLIGGTDKSLSSKAQQVLESIKVVEYPFVLREVVLPDVDVFTAPDTFLQVVNDRGQVQARSGNLGRRVLPLSAETLSVARQEKQPFFETISVQGSSIRLFNQPLLLQDRFIGIVQVGQSLAQVERTLARLKYLLGIGTLVTLAVAVSVGLILAGIVLNPIKRVSETAAEIDSGRHLNRRIEYQGANDEIGQLVATLNAMFARLEQAYRRLEETYSAQRRFVADASHELRSPLTTISGNIELLQKITAAGQLPDAELLQDIREETRRMTRLIEDMLALARADAGLQLNKEVVPLAPLLEDVIRAAKRRAQGREFLYSGVEEVGSIKVLANTDYLKQAVLILLDNGFKYSGDSGRVQLGTTVAGNRVEIWVEDNGQGIKEEHLPHLFKRFYRSDEARGPGGTGLGLAIAKWIIEEHGGDIAVKSRWQEGSKFSLWLPINA